MSTCWLAFCCDSASSRASNTLEVISPHVDEHLLDAVLAHHAVEVELQIAGVAAAVAVVHLDFKLAERVDALHQILVRAIAPTAV